MTDSLPLYPKEEYRFRIGGIELWCMLTCPSHPEQYDVFLDGVDQVGYLRLRHGEFRADYGECGGPTVYSATYTDPWMGVFESPMDRRERLYQACKAIARRLSSTSSN